MANNGAYIEIDGEKQYIKRELRFLRHSSPFNTRDDAKAYIESEVAADNINSDYAQPVVVRYIDAGGEQIILGIGKGDNGYHFIDSAAIEHDLKAIIASVGTGDEGYDLVYDDKKLLSVKDQLSEINLLIQNGDETTSFDADHTIAAKIDEILEFIKNAVTSVGLNEDGTMGEFVSDEYIHDAENLKDAVEILDGQLFELQKEVTANKVSSSDKSINVTTDASGTDIGVNIDNRTIVLDDNGTVLTSLQIKKYDEGDNIDSNLLAVYKLVDKNGNPIEGSRDIEVPKDRTLYNVAIGDMADEFNRPYEGDVHKTLMPDDIKSCDTGHEALRFIYQLSDGVYQMVLISLESFVIEAEFKDGLTVSNHEVSVKLDRTPGSDSQKYLRFVNVPGGNAAVGLHGISDAIQAETDRATEMEDKIIEAVGLNPDGTYDPYDTGKYTSGATSVLDATSILDDKIVELENELSKTKIVGDKAIKVTTGETGSTISLLIDQNDKILTNSDDGLLATVSVAKLTDTELEDIGETPGTLEAYKVVGTDGATALGEIIKIGKGDSLYSVAMGDMGDKFANPTIDDYHSNDTNVDAGSTGRAALRFISRLADGSYYMTLIDIESFISESEFKDGLKVVDGEVYAKLDTTPGSDSEKFLFIKPIEGENGAIALSGITEAIQVETDRATEQEDKIEESVGLASDGSYIRTTDRFTSGATSVVEAIQMLNDGIEDTERIALTAEEKAIKARVRSATPAIDVNYTDTIENGTLVGLKINELDNFLSQDAGLLATIKMTKVTGVTQDGTAYTAIRLLGKNEQIVSEIDASDFVKDGFLDDVDVITRGGKNYLVFTWNTASGKERTEILVDDMVKPYTASSGVTLDAATNNLSGVVDPNSDPYLTVGSDGFKLSGVKTAIDTTNNELTNLKNFVNLEINRIIQKDGEQDIRIILLEAWQSGTTEDIRELQIFVQELSESVNDKLDDLYSANGGIEIYNADEEGKKYRTLKFKIGDTPDTTEAILPEINYLRIVTETDGAGRYTGKSGLHTTIRPLTDSEIATITNITNMQQ